MSSNAGRLKDRNAGVAVLALIEQIERILRGYLGTVFPDDQGVFGNPIALDRGGNGLLAKAFSIGRIKENQVKRRILVRR